MSSPLCSLISVPVFRSLINCIVLCSKRWAFHFALCLHVSEKHHSNKLYNHSFLMKGIIFDSWTVFLIKRRWNNSCTRLYSLQFLDLANFDRHWHNSLIMYILKLVCVAAMGHPVARRCQSSFTWTGPRCWWAALVPSSCAVTGEAAAFRAPNCCTGSRRNWACLRSRIRRMPSSMWLQ